MPGRYDLLFTKYEFNVYCENLYKIPEFVGKNIAIGINSRIFYFR